MTSNRTEEAGAGVSPNNAAKPGAPNAYFDALLASVLTPSIPPVTEELPGVLGVAEAARAFDWNAPAPSPSMLIPDNFEEIADRALRLAEAQRLVASIPHGPDRDAANGLLHELEQALRAGRPLPLEALQRIEQMVAKSTGTEATNVQLLSDAERLELERRELDKRWQKLKNDIDQELAAKGVDKETRDKLNETLEGHRERAIEYGVAGNAAAAENEAQKAQEAAQGAGVSEDNSRAVGDGVRQVANNGIEMRKHNYLSELTELGKEDPAKLAQQDHAVALPGQLGQLAPSQVSDASTKPSSIADIGL